MIQKEIIETFTTSDLYNIVDEFFTQHFWVDFAYEVICETSIENVEQYVRKYCIAQICEYCTREQLIQSGWLFDDEGTEED